MFGKLKYFALFSAFFFSVSALAKVNIGAIAPLSGDYVTAGTEIMTGVKTAIEEINQQGGLLGKKLKFIPIEDECNDSLAVSTAQMIALNKEQESKITAIIGPYCFNQFQTVTETFAKAGIFQIIPTAVSAKYEQNTQNSLIKMVGSKKQQAQDFFAFYQKTFDWANIAFITDKSHEEMLHAMQNIFAKKNKSDHLKIYIFEDYDFDYDKIAESAIKDKTQAAFVVGDMSNVSYMAKELRSKKHKYMIFVDKYQVMPEFETIMGDLMSGCYFMSLPSLKDSPEFTETLVKLRLLGIEPEGLAVYGYTAVQLWADLVKKSKSFDYNKLANTLRNNSFDSGWGKLMFTNGNPTQPLGYRIYLYKGGEYTQVY
ncbi:MAG: ABC transporter substrate-binding protein [Alphaproteobacteria bacterium]|nr:ABC transporter substrate-binding protein [Alphaproteobacteria bacterium]